ncbi:hypothetical protein LPAF129_19700 [Ligilactobacillus pabuli]|uniref:DUF1819 family protein n=1 Tax=Ligilactobacillus pabuli TaxID=2886039 RepID=A0ABQ5JJJ3_9LACO|nr:DUF1819 family protein [Ligilactobacillus pabuli]GKS82284.1 hypothetical protein LPAF129_19700 [Ligilactobacillus pabuli]
MPKYSAAIISHNLWFNEFNIYLNYVLEGKTIAEVNELSDNENVLQAKTPTRARQISRILGHRVEALPQSIKDLYPTLDVTNQKVVDFLSVMLCSKLMSEFMYEVYRDELILGDMRLDDSEIQAFLTEKQGESEQVAGWTSQTIHRLKGCFKTFVRETGLVMSENNGVSDKVTPIFLDDRLVQTMKDEKLDYELSSLKG